MTSNSSKLHELIRKELRSYWVMHSRLVLRILVLVSTTMSLIVSVFTLILLINPVVLYKGYILSGYVSPLRYELLVEGIRVKYPYLDSVNTVAWFTLVFTVFLMVFLMFSLIAYRTSTRTALLLIGLSNLIALLVFTLLYSLLRVLSTDIVPVLPTTVYALATGGRLMLDPPQAHYTLSYYLPRNFTLFIVVYVVLAVLASLALVYLALTPTIPVTKNRRKNKKNQHNTIQKQYYGSK